MTHLFLNMIDPDTPLFKPPLFDSALSFIDRYFPTRKVLIHCNKGNSRAPSLALLYLAKRARVINSENYATATNDFRTNSLAINQVGAFRYISLNIGPKLNDTDEKG